MPPSLIRKVAGTVIVAVVAIVAAVQFSRSAARVSETARELSMSSSLAQSALDPKTAVRNEALRPIGPVLDGDPLNASVFLREGLAKGRAGDQTAARALIRESIRRDPRSKPARFWLMVDALKRGYNQQALAQLDRLLALNPQEGVVYFPVLAALVRDPATLPKLQEMYSRKPGWGGDFLGYLAANKGNASIVFALINRAGTGANSQHAALLRSLIDQQDYDRAYLAWVNLLPADALASVSPIYDGAFEGRPGLTPFNWTLSANEVATATIERGVGLVIDYSGEAATTMAEQTILLEPQSYRLTYTASGEAPAEEGKQITLRLLCLPDRSVIYEGPLAVGGTRAIDVTVPPTCLAQQLTIEGTPGEFPSQRQVTLRNITVAAR